MSLPKISQHIITSVREQSQRNISDSLYILNKMKEMKEENEDLLDAIINTAGKVSESVALSLIDIDNKLDDITEEEREQVTEATAELSQQFDAIMEMDFNKVDLNKLATMSVQGNIFVNCCMLAVSVYESIKQQLICNELA